MSVKLNPVIVVHGGAWAIPDDLADASREGVKAAVMQGYKVCKTRQWYGMKYTADFCRKKYQQKSCDLSVIYM